MCNNPSLLAVNVAERIWPGRRCCLTVSLGTGLNEKKQGGVQGGTDMQGVSQIIEEIVEHLTNVEIVHNLLKAEKKDNYVRLNPPNIDIALDESDPKKIQKMLEITSEYIYNNDIQFEATAKSLFASSECFLLTLQVGFLTYLLRSVLFAIGQRVSNTTYLPNSRSQWK